MPAPYINIHTHRVPETSVETDGFPSKISVLSLDSCDETGTSSPGLLYSVGIHPWSTVNATQDPRFADEKTEELRRKLSLEPVVMIGEAGFDPFRGASIGIQREVFIRQVELSELYRLPLVIHLVKTADELTGIYRQTRPTQTWIIHGFRYKGEQASQLLKQGFHLSFGPRYNEESMRRAWDTGRMWLETDDTNYDIADIYGMASDTLQVPVWQIRERIYQQAKLLFGAKIGVRSENTDKS